MIQHKVEAKIRKIEYDIKILSKKIKAIEAYFYWFRKIIRTNNRVYKEKLVDEFEKQHNLAQVE